MALHFLRDFAWRRDAIVARSTVMIGWMSMVWMYYWIDSIGAMQT